MRVVHVLDNLGLGRAHGNGLPTIVRGIEDAQDSPSAAHSHALDHCDLGGHLQRKFNFRPFAERHNREQKSSARTEVLSEAESLSAGGNVAQRYGKVKSEALSNAAFNTNRRSSYGHGTSLENRRGREQLQL